MDNRIDQVIELYEIFYRNLTGNKKFKFVYNKTNLSLVKNFVDRLDHRHDVNWLFDYFSFQFNYRSTQEINPNFMFGKVKIMLSWVIGNKAYLYYKNSSEEDKYYGREYAIKRKIKNPFKKDVYAKFESSELKSYEDREKRRYFNSDMGLVHCMQLGLNYDSKSKYCLTCKNKRSCIELVIK